MPSLLNPAFNFSSLSVKDLIEARDLFHVHLLNKANVIATAIGRYLIRFDDLDPTTKRILPEDKRLPPGKRKGRTLFNSTVVDESYPCVLVFVSDWINESDLSEKFAQDLTQIVPKRLYMPDGRIIPVCTVKADKSRDPDEVIDENKLLFPQNMVGGGFPLKVFSQGVERVASVGCIVSDGHTYYALTNKHVAGAPGSIISTELKGVEMPVGRASAKQLGTVSFKQAYPNWPGENILLNADIGLVEIDDITQWKTDVLGIGQLGPLADFNTNNLTLNVIGVNVSAHGAVSGDLKGQVKALFYRYKSVGGYEYIADFLVGPRINDDLTFMPFSTRHGDSGTLWVLDEVPGDEITKTVTCNLPLALHWGQQKFVEGSGSTVTNFALATCLSNISRILEVDILRDWNLDQDFSWGKTGHFKTAAFSCELVRDPVLKKLLMANQKNIGYDDSSFLNDKVMSGAFTESFVPLADVADIYWRSKRPNDKRNHFADMDETHPLVENGKSLLDLCRTKSNIDVDVWLKFYAELDEAEPIIKTTASGQKRKDPRMGALPFRVWQMYRAMIAFLKDKSDKDNVAKFIVAGGTMSHYVGDASQPLHISHLHHGEDKEEAGVHSDFENKMIDRNMKDFLNKVNKAATAVKASDLIGASGQDAAELVISLMRNSIKHLPPQDVLETWRNNSGAGKMKAMWEALGNRTAENVAAGARVMAILWESAWKAGGGDSIAKSKIREIDKKTLMKFYKNSKFVESFFLNNPQFKKALR